MEKKPIMSICVHCGKNISHFQNRLWHSVSAVFPQYCATDPALGSRLHEPPTGVLGHLPRITQEEVNV